MTRRPRITAAVVFAVGAAIAIAVAARFASESRRTVAERFAIEAQAMAKRVTERIRAYEYGLRGARGALVAAGVEQVNRRQFKAYSDTRDIDREFPGARGIGVIWRVAQADEPTFVAAAREDGWPGYTIRQLEAHSGERFVIRYVEPVQRNREAVGLDIASEANRREAALASMRSGQATLTAPITLVQATGNPTRSFLLLLPIYRTGAPLATAQEREVAAIGWSYAPLVIDEVLAGLITESGAMTLSLRDVSAGQSQMFYETPGGDAAARTGLTHDMAIPIFGRTWRATLHATPAFVQKMNVLDARVVAAAGVALAAALALLALAIAQSAARAAQIRAEQARRAAIVREMNATLEEQVRERTAQLESALRDNAAMLGTLHQHAIVSVADRSGRITEVNDSFCRISGYSREELLGHHHSIVNSAHHPRSFWVEMWRDIAQGKPWRNEVCNRAKDGSIYWVDSIVAPFVDAAGRVEKYISIRTDITARKNAELSLAYERDLMTALLNTVPDQIYFKDRDSRFLRINPGLARRYGLTDPAQAIGLSDSDFFTAAHASRTAELERRIIETGEPVIDVEEMETWPDRPPTWNATTKMPLRDSDGQIIGTFGISRDITHRRHIENELARTNDRFALASDAAGIGVWEFDIVAGTLTWDDWMYRLYGRQRDHTVPAFGIWGDSLHPDDRERGIHEIQDAIEGVREFDTEFRVVRPDGAVRHLRAAARVQRDEQGRALRMTGVNLDITDRTRAEQQLVQTSTLLKNVLDSATEIAVVAVDPQGQIKVFNRGAERMLGFRREEVVDHESALRFHDRAELSERARELSKAAGRHVPSAQALVDDAALGQPHDWTYERKDGSRLSVSLVVTALRDEHGQSFGYLGVAHDITRQKQTEQSLREAVHSAKRANQAKSQFLANMSHEIRTPLNAVVGLTYLLSRSPLDEAQADSLAKIQVASKSLLSVVNDVLDFSKIEAGEMALEQRVFSLRLLLRELRDVMGVHAHAKQIGLDIEQPADLPNGLLGDSVRLNQILTNLVSNAIKFTSEGIVRLKVEQLMSSPGRVRMRYTVTDSGIGIASDVQARLFQPFAQADDSTTRRFGGTGLGLSIVKRLVTLMGGTVGLRSEPGVGSEFWAEIEFALACAEAYEYPAHELPTHQGPALSRIAVLVVDDSDINLEVARRILQLEGADVTLCSNGAQAVDCLRARPHDFDAVLMDVQMPVLDGFAATRFIRGDLGLLELPVIALTAGVLRSERDQAIAAGMDDFIGKPFEAHQLVRCLQRHVGTPHSAPLTAARPPLAAGGVPEAAWPAIDGIDVVDARQRLGGDAELFATMLRLLVDEFDGLRAPSSSDEPSSLVAHASVLHKLRGVAGNVGAKALCDVAGRAEAACRANDFQRAVELTTEVASLVRQLRRAMPAGDGNSAVAEQTEPLQAAGALDPGAWQQLRTALKAQDLAATGMFRALLPALRHRCSPLLLEHVREQVAGLRFAEALSTLEAELGHMPQAKVDVHAVT